MLKYLYSVIVVMTSMSWVYANVSRFELEVRPTTIAVNQAADLIAKVVDQDGNTIKDYDKDVFIEIEQLSDSEAELPWGGIYQFQTTDQGNKIFSKGLTIKKEWTFKVVMSDILDSKIKWEVTVVVTKDGAWKSSWYITVISPLPDSIESESSIHVYGRSELKNSPLELYMDGIKIKDSKTSNNGDFSFYLNDVSSWAHILQLKIKDLNNILIGSSDEIRFTYLDQNVGLFKTLDILPSPLVKIGAKVTLVVKTAQSVSTAEVIFPDAKKIILDKVGAWEFKKDLIADTPGSYPLSVKLSTNTEKKQFDKVKTLTVMPAVVLGPVKGMRVQSDPTQIDLNRTVSGQVDVYKVIYGLSAQDLDLTTNTQTTSLTVPDTDTSKTYFFKIYPQDTNGNDLGAASDIVQVWPIQNNIKTASVCIIDNIQLSSKQIGDAHYITWNQAPWAVKYDVYRSEKQTDNILEMVKVGETVETQFEYPFDPNASQELYAYYRVKGICADNKTVKLSNVKEVKVGPKENIMMLMLIGLIVYSIFQLKSIKRSS